MDIGLIFDMDGVIIDSNPYHKTVWSEFFRDKGIPYDERDFESIISGKPATTTIRNFLGSQLDEEEVSLHLEEVDGAWVEILRTGDGIEPLPGLVVFLTSIRKNGYKTALATSATTQVVDHVLARLDLRPFFDIILDRENVTHGKPHPEIYINTVERLGIHKDRCVVFEDSKAGIRSAHDAGLKVVGVATEHTAEELLEEGVSMVISDFTGLDPDDILHLLNESKNPHL
jgi:beta-phosphoglucomutase